MGGVRASPTFSKLQLLHSVFQLLDGLARLGRGGNCSCVLGLRLGLRNWRGLFAQTLRRAHELADGRQFVLVLAILWGDGR